ncbi:universal stress protein [Streptomyces hydrogenans]|uniref:universal stress protein n=1 Tax=Streptomyces hydrogenans TaxID=1873719 RepID=UPI00278BAF36|nr:universal stress protein [Streptomyces hydrogenans]
MSSETPVRPARADVVVGIDGSPSSRTAALWAAAEADRRSRPLHLVHAADTDLRAYWSDAETIQAVREAGRDLLAATEAEIRERFPDLVVTRLLGRRAPLEELQEAAGAEKPIVVGSRGLGGFSALLLGSVGLGVAARADVPVIVVRGEADRPEAGSVTAAVRDTGDLGWLLLAAAAADDRKVPLHLLSVWNILTHVGDVATMLDDLDGAAHRRVHEVKALADRVRAWYPDLIVTHHVRTGTSTPGILVDASAHTDLVVMGRGHRPLGVGPALGRVAHALIHHAHCPVEIVPADFGTRSAAP